ncbi:helix-turn-helix domain-containing protein, partial [Nocardioides sp. NPDC000441]|uniref:TetR/AcrR family transcriptional regulator n=1 Tax=Nocardioides sp. NPDC000441 TaxID=3154256 RepID=UPI003332BC71
MTDPAASIRPRRKRQARGEERMREIVRAAAVVFAERGPDGATTNAIAAEAGISPGSLYQFFGSKADIARALSEHYAAELSGVRRTIMDVGQEAWGGGAGDAGGGGGGGLNHAPPRVEAPIG